MADYGMVGPGFWTGETGRAIRAKGPEAQVVALYLMTCRHRNPLGIYYLPSVLIPHETGLQSPSEGASEGLSRGFKGGLEALRSLIEVGFCSFDWEAEVVWVHEMARFQILQDKARLDPKDNRVKWINARYEDLPKNQFLGAFFDRYGEALGLKARRDGAKPLRSPSEAPPKPVSVSVTDKEYPPPCSPPPLGDDTSPPADPTPPATHSGRDNPEAIPCGEIVDHLNAKAGTKFLATAKATKSLIKARWREGHRLEDFKAVIDHRAGIWLGDSKMEEYLRPQTLFSGKFEAYLQAARRGRAAGGNGRHPPPIQPRTYRECQDAERRAIADSILKSFEKEATGHAEIGSGDGDCQNLAIERRQTPGSGACGPGGDFSGGP
jgi:uncharacterized phage protein (TIGR02220 family)